MCAQTKFCSIPTYGPRDIELPSFIVPYIRKLFIKRDHAIEISMTNRLMKVLLILLERPQRIFVHKPILVVFQLIKRHNYIEF